MEPKAAISEHQGASHWLEWVRCCDYVDHDACNRGRDAQAWGSSNTICGLGAKSVANRWCCKMGVVGLTGDGCDDGTAGQSDEDFGASCVGGVAD